MSDLKLSQPWLRCSRRRFVGTRLWMFSLLRPYAAQASEIPAALESTEPPRDRRFIGLDGKIGIGGGMREKPWWTVFGNCCVTTPSHKETGKLYEGRSGYLHSKSSLSPFDYLFLIMILRRNGTSFGGTSPGTPSVLRKQRHGRPPVVGCEIGISISCGWLPTAGHS